MKNKKIEKILNYFFILYVLFYAIILFVAALIDVKSFFYHILSSNGVPVQDYIISSFTLSLILIATAFLIYQRKFSGYVLSISIILLISIIDNLMSFVMNSSELTSLTRIIETIINAIFVIIGLVLLKSQMTFTFLYGIKKLLARNPN